MTTEQEDKWKKEFIELSKRDDWHEEPLEWAIYKTACQSMQAQVDLLRSMFDTSKKYSYSLESQIKQLKAEMEKAREVIGFYANKNNWQTCGFDYGFIGITREDREDIAPPTTDDIYISGGKRAREWQEQDKRKEK